MTTSGVPEGICSDPLEKSDVASHISSSAAHAMNPPNWSCFRRIGDDRDALA